MGFQCVELNESAPMGLTVPPGATRALISAEGRVRWRDDGLPPTAKLGHPLDDERMFYGGPLTTIKFIAEAGRTSVLSVSFYR
jgi:hypothetical protein